MAYRVAQVMPLKEEWKAARTAAGLKTKLTPAAPDRAKRLVAELHVLIEGAGSLPPGAVGAYVLLELGDHVARSAFVPASGYESWYYEDAHAAMYPGLGGGWGGDLANGLGGGWGGGGGFAGEWPQRFKLTIDEDIAKDKDKKYGVLFIDVVAWLPQAGELSLGQIEVPVPKKKEESCRMRFDTPVRAELHWQAYGAPAKRGVDAWENAEEPVMLPTHGGYPWAGPGGRY